MVVASAGNTARAFGRVCSENRIPLLLCVPEDNLEAIWADGPWNDCVKLGDYPRERLGRVTIFAGGCWVIYSMVSISIAMAIQLTGLDKMLPGAERAESQGVVLRVPEGSDKVVVEPLPVETRKAE